MPHERWVRRSEQALERSWLRALSHRERGEAREPRARVESAVDEARAALQPLRPASLAQR